MVYIPQKVVMGQVEVNILSNHPIPDDWELINELPDEDVMSIEIQPLGKMYFDRAAHRGGAGIDVVFVTLQEQILPPSFTLKQFQQCH